MLRHAARCSLGLVGVALLALFAFPADLFAQSSNSVAPARLRYFEGSVSVQRAAAGDSESALVNLPLGTGDRLWTEQDGRAELVLDGGTVVWLDGRTTLDLVNLTPQPEGPAAILRLWAGSALVSRPQPDRGAFLDIVRVDAPAGSVTLAEAGLYRIDVDEAQGLWLSTYNGYAELDAGGLSEGVGAGQRTYAELGNAPARPVSFNTAEDDGFAAWQADRESVYVDTVKYVEEHEYVPRTIVHHVVDLHGHGSWHYYPTYQAWYWRPYVAVGWTPYRHGRWVFGIGGWTWVPYEPWGWATVHYGRWHFVSHHGWVWFPGRVYSPAWVQWYVGRRYVGWVPLNFYDRPAVSINLFFAGRGRLGPRRNVVVGGSTRGLEVGPIGSASGTARVVNGLGYTSGNADAWTFVPSDRLSATDVPRVAVARTEAAERVRADGESRALISGPLRARQPESLVPRSTERRAVPRGTNSAVGPAGAPPASGQSTGARAPTGVSSQGYRRAVPSGSGDTTNPRSTPPAAGPAGARGTASGDRSTGRAVPRTEPREAPAARSAAGLRSGASSSGEGSGRRVATPRPQTGTTGTTRSRIPTPPQGPTVTLPRAQPRSGTSSGRSRVPTSRPSSSVTSPRTSAPRTAVPRRSVTPSRTPSSSSRSRRAPAATPRVAPRVSQPRGAVRSPTRPSPSSGRVGAAPRRAAPRGLQPRSSGSARGPSSGASKARPRTAKPKKPGGGG